MVLTLSFGLWAAVNAEESETLRGLLFSRYGTRRRIHQARMRKSSHGKTFDGAVETMTVEELMKTKMQS